jgi:hypothetical protein
MKRKKPKNKKLVYGIVLIILLIMISMIVKSLAAYYDSKTQECVMQQTSCCGCEMGGKEECMTLEEAKTTRERLAKECSKDIFCTANYVCEDVECKMVNGECKKG